MRCRAHAAQSRMHNHVSSQTRRRSMVTRVSIERVLSHIRELDHQARDARDALDSFATKPQLFQQHLRMLDTIKLQRKRLAEVVADVTRRGAPSVPWRHLVPKEER